MVAKHQGQITGGSSSQISKALGSNVLFELMKASQALQETIATSTIRNKNIYELIKRLTKKKDGEDAREVNSEQEEE